MADFGQEPSLVFVVPTAIPKPCVGLVHVGREYQDWLVRFRHSVQAFNPFHRQAFLAWRIRPSRVQFTLHGEMVSERSGRLQDTHSLRMWICQRRKSVGVGFMGLWFRFSKDINNLPTFSQHPLEIFYRADDLVPVPRLLNDPLPPFLREGLLALGVFELQEHGPSGG
jgi:hypothetical protein